MDKTGKDRFAICISCPAVSVGMLSVVVQTNCETRRHARRAARAFYCMGIGGLIMSGKGDRPRPIPNKPQFEANWDAIFNKPKPEKKDKPKKP